LLHLHANNEHVSPPSSNVLFPGNNNHSSITSSRSSISSTLYSTASLGSGSEAGGHPVILFNSTPTTTAPTMLTASTMTTALTTATTNTTNRIQTSFAPEVAGSHVTNLRLTSKTNDKRKSVMSGLFAMNSDAVSQSNA
jgi:hypothetical protein